MPGAYARYNANRLRPSGMSQDAVPVTRAAYVRTAVGIRVLACTSTGW